MRWPHILLGHRRSEPTSTALVQKKPGNIHVFRIGGLLNKQVLDRIQLIATQDIPYGTRDLKVLIVLVDFRGCRRDDDWGAPDFFTRHNVSIARMAVVGDDRWETDALEFLAVGHRSGTVRFFTPEQQPQACVWLANEEP